MRRYGKMKQLVVYYNLKNEFEREEGAHHESESFITERKN